MLGLGTHRIWVEGIWAQHGKIKGIPKKGWVQVFRHSWSHWHFLHGGLFPATLSLTAMSPQEQPMAPALWKTYVRSQLSPDRYRIEYSCPGKSHVCLCISRSEINPYDQWGLLISSVELVEWEGYPNSLHEFYTLASSALHFLSVTCPKNQHLRTVH